LRAGTGVDRRGLSLITRDAAQGRQHDINDGVYGSFDALILPGWTADCNDRAGPKLFSS
jgi:hypothetical protein